MSRSLLYYTKRYNQINKNELSKTTNIEVHRVFDDKDLTLDNWIDKNFLQLLIDRKFNNIIIPLSPSYAISDFLGLLIAMHIRCTNSINQNANIFIYGFHGYKELLRNEFFDILKVKGVCLIDYNLEDILKASNNELVIMNNVDIPKELSKINLKIPANLYDNHSIANVWGIHRLLEIEGVDKKEIHDLNGNDLLNTIYFKWLLAKNKISEKIIEEAKEVTKVYRHKLKGTKLITTIDLSKHGK